MERLPEDDESLTEVAHSDMLSHIYFTGYSLSLVALIMAITIFFYFKFVMSESIHFM